MKNFTLSIAEGCSGVILTPVVGGTYGLDDVSSFKTFKNCCERNTYDFCIPTLAFGRCDENEDRSVTVELIASGFCSDVVTATYQADNTGTIEEGSTIYRADVKIPSGIETSVIFTLVDENGLVYEFKLTLENATDDCTLTESPIVYDLEITEETEDLLCGITVTGTEVTFDPCAFAPNCATCTDTTLTNGIYSVQVDYGEGLTETFCILSECDSLFCKVAAAYLESKDKEIINTYYALVGVSEALNSTDTAFAECEVYFGCQSLCDLYLVLLNLMNETINDSPTQTYLGCGC